LQTRHNFIQYLNNTYQLLNCCPVAALSQNDLYLSKLVITASSEHDTGFYICLAINDVNYTLKETYINVVPPKVTDVRPQTRSFLILFLIPALFALIPTLIWLMSLQPKKFVSMDTADQPATNTKLMLAGNHVLCGHPKTNPV